MSDLSRFFGAVISSVAVVEVRDQSEWGTGHLPEAKHLPPVDRRGEQGSVG